MMSAHGANQIFFNNKKKIGRPEHLLPLPPPNVRQHLIFALSPSHPTPYNRYEVLSDSDEVIQTDVIMIMRSYLIMSRQAYHHGK